jgi:hypothetical protein
MMTLFKLLTKNCEKRCFKLSELSCEFPKMPFTVFNMGSENGYGFHVFRAIPQRWNRFLSHIIAVTEDEIWV